MVLCLAISAEHTAGVLSGYTHQFRLKAKVAFLWLRAKQLISSCPMLIVNSWLPAVLWQPSPRERRIIGSTTLDGIALKDSLNSQLFWNQSWKWRMQVAERRGSEKAFSKGGLQPLTDGHLSISPRGKGLTAWIICLLFPSSWRWHLHN